MTLHLKCKCGVVYDFPLCVWVFNKYTATCGCGQPLIEFEAGKWTTFHVGNVLIT